jgi:RNA polymerase sigma factor (TIGR02999 family)
MDGSLGGTDSGITELLLRCRRGDKQAEEQLISAVYAELHKIAAAYLRRERPDHSLQASALVNEAYIKLAGLTQLDWQNRSHFFGVAARIMREVLVDHARARRAEKRGRGLQLVPLDEAMIVEKRKTTDILALNEALDDLAKKDPRAARVVECRYFAGLSVDETAAALGIAPRTVKHDWQFGRAWLLRQLSGRAADA